MTIEKSGTFRLGLATELNDVGFQSLPTMKVLLLGAGASKAYSESPTGVSPPIARDFWNAFRKLKNASHPWVMLHRLMLFLEQYKQQSFTDFLHTEVDIEEFHSEIEELMRKSLSGHARIPAVIIGGAYTELIFLFAFVMNEIQNGPISRAHQSLARALNQEDVVVTFNWDTLMDRALAQETNWKTDFGYGVVPRLVYQEGWKSPESTNERRSPLLLKLHGSTNWLTSHININKDDQVILTQSSSPETLHILECAQQPYETYEGRFMPGYQEFSYGYYPPNLPDLGRSVEEGHVLVRYQIKNPFMPEGESGDSGLVSMPLIIPPVKEKQYDLFGDLFTKLWYEAETALTRADQIIIIGYSFPRTDHQSNNLFLKAFKNRTTIPQVSIVLPKPDSLASKFHLEFGIPEDHIFSYPEYFEDGFDLPRLFRGHD